MGIVLPQESAWVKEMAKWETRAVNVNGTFVMPLSMREGGKADWPFQAYPKMLYKAQRADGGPRIDVLGGTGTLIVHSEQEEARERDRGWCDGQEVAIAAIHAEDKLFAQLAANRTHNDRLMSERAHAEATAAEEGASGHLPAIPETAIKRRGRPRAAVKE